jgi:hypothetical protein
MPGYSKENSTNNYVFSLNYKNATVNQAQPYVREGGIIYALHRSI